MNETIATDAGPFLVSRPERSRASLVICGPTPIERPSPLLVVVRRATAADRRAIRDGVARKVAGLDAQLDDVAFVETELDDATVLKLLAVSAQRALVGAVQKHHATLSVRSRYAVVDVEPRRKSGVSEAEARDLVPALASIARAARALPPNADPLREWIRHVMAAYVAVFVAGVLTGVWWDWVRLVGAGSMQVIGGALAVTVVSFGLARFVARRIVRGRTTSHQIAFHGALLLGLAVGALTLHVAPRVNVAFDDGVAVAHEATITHFRKGRMCVREDRGGTPCLLVTEGWDDALSFADGGARVVITERPGALGLPWVERIRRAP